MSDLPPLILDNKKRLDILAALNEIKDLPEPYQPGDVTVKHIMKQFHVTHSKARDMMGNLIAKYPNQFKEVLVTLPGTYHNKPGYIIRAIEDPTLWETSEELPLPLESEQSGS